MTPAQIARAFPAYEPGTVMLAVRLWQGTHECTRAEAVEALLSVAAGTRSAYGMRSLLTKEGMHRAGRAGGVLGAEPWEPTSTPPKP